MSQSSASRHPDDSDDLDRRRRDGRRPRAAQIVDGALAATRHFDLGVLLVGAARRDRARAGAPDRPSIAAACAIVDAPDVIDDGRVAVGGAAAQAGIVDPRRGRAVARGEAAALFSAGHTGATVMAAHGAFGLLPGVDRPALAATIPTRRGPAVLLDVGASVECRPQHLLQFAVMGGVYARVGLGIESPRIGLLSIGEEASKGNELTREAHRLLKTAPVSFIGNVEARDVSTAATPT